MANTSALKKGAPPPRETNRSLIQTDPRPLEGKNKPLQLMVPPEVFLAFSAPGRRGIWLHERLKSLDSFSPCGKHTLPCNHGNR